MKRMQHYIEFFLYKIGILLLGNFSLPVLWGIGKWVGWMNFYVFRIRRRVIDAQLALIYPEWSSSRRHQFIRCYLQRQFFFFLDFIKLMHLNASKLKQRVNNDGQYQKWCSQVTRERLIFVAGHFANFVMGTLYVHTAIHPVAGIVKRQSNYLIHRDFYQWMAKKGMILLENRRDIKKISKLEIPPDYSLGILIDQDAGRKGVMVPFMGFPASTSRGPAYLISKYRLRPIMVGMYLEKNLNYRIILDDLGAPDSDDPEYLMGCINQHLSGFIDLHPLDWFWLHRRWKTQVKRGEVTD
ncbi:MAG: hypothetical protein KBA26_00545 [Candidatus Delongbacteria bacterium]|nr:hypothetical protein [Candidatus Delongbacteria bacterium]